MLADEILREGHPKEALAKLQDQVRNSPANAEYRTFLFQLLSLLGEWDRAMTQLSVVADLDAGTLAIHGWVFDISTGKIIDLNFDLDDLMAVIRNIYRLA